MNEIAKKENPAAKLLARLDGILEGEDEGRKIESKAQTQLEPISSDFDRTVELFKTIFKGEIGS